MNTINLRTPSCLTLLVSLALGTALPHRASAQHVTLDAATGTSIVVGFNPQPEPPGRHFNPQPEPPGEQFNPQPEPPGRHLWVDTSDETQAVIGYSVRKAGGGGGSSELRKAGGPKQELTVGIGDATRRVEGITIPAGACDNAQAITLLSADAPEAAVAPAGACRSGILPMHVALSDGSSFELTLVVTGQGSDVELASVNSHRSDPYKNFAVNSHRSDPYKNLVGLTLEIAAASSDVEIAVVLEQDGGPVELH